MSMYNWDWENPPIEKRNHYALYLYSSQDPDTWQKYLVLSKHPEVPLSFAIYFEGRLWPCDY